MNKNLRYVGLDVHAQTDSIAIAESDGEVRNYGAVSSGLETLEKTMGKIRKAHPGTELRGCYEAGPTCFVIARRFAQLGIDRMVVAPSLIPNRSGDRVKTDPRDAVKLARLHRAGELTAVNVPDASDEAMRDLCRARTDAVQDLRRVLSLALFQRQPKQQVQVCNGVSSIDIGGYPFSSQPQGWNKIKHLVVFQVSLGGNCLLEQGWI